MALRAFEITEVARRKTCVEVEVGKEEGFVTSPDGRLRRRSRIAVFSRLDQSSGPEISGPKLRLSHTPAPHRGGVEHGESLQSIPELEEARCLSELQVDTLGIALTQDLERSFWRPEPLGEISRSEHHWGARTSRFE